MVSGGPFESACVEGLCLFSQPGDVLIRLIENLDRQFEFAVSAPGNRHRRRLATEYQEFVQSKRYHKEVLDKLINEAWDNLGSPRSISSAKSIECLRKATERDQSAGGDVIGAAFREFERKPANK
eukprot:Selendium_serpulae@DN5990_c0_g1_i1.p1